MILSTEQTRAANAGLRAERRWEWLDMPAGPQPLPSWIIDAHVEWRPEYENSPDVRLKVREELRTWDDKRFVKEGGRYMAVSPDGRAEIYHHGGRIETTKLRRYRRADGSTTIQPGLECVRAGGEWEEYDGLATSQDRGFGGASIPITLVDGTKLVLRGPWHGGAPAGFVEAAYVNVVKDRRDGWMDWHLRRTHRVSGPIWLKMTAMGGLYLREEVYVTIIARFLPWVRLARCTFAGHTTIDLVHPNWPAPKQWLPREQRQVA